MRKSLNFFLTIISAGCSPSNQAFSGAIGAAQSTIGSTDQAAAISHAALPQSTGVATHTLPPLDMSGNAHFNWSAPFLASDWASQYGVLPWKFDHVTGSGTDVVLTMDASGTAQVQGQKATPAFADGLWEADVTVPVLRPGVDVAAFYLYENSTHHEIDFEFYGTLGLMVTLHTNEGATQSVKIAEASEFSGKRLKLSIKASQASGYIAMQVNGIERYRFEKKNRNRLALRAHEALLRTPTWHERAG